MIGQGSPRLIQRAWGAAFACAALLAAAGSVCAQPPSPTDAAVSIQIRLEWGAGAPRQWSGTVRLTGAAEETSTEPAPGGRLGEFRSLAIEADAPTALSFADGVLQIAPAAPRSYDGLDLWLHGRATDELIVDLQADGAPGRGPATISLAALLKEKQHVPLDDAGNYLVVQRTPGDALRVTPDEPRLIFRPREQIGLSVAPAVALAGAEEPCELHWRLVRARSDGPELAADFVPNVAAGLGLAEPVRCELAAPADEGAYELVLSVERPRSGPRLLAKPPLALRRVQFLVLDDRAPPSIEREPPAELLLELDPANPQVWQRLRGMNLPGMRRGPLASTELLPREHPAGRFAELCAAGPERVAQWQAYPLPVAHPGQLHVLEVEYPADVPQTLGLSVVEPNAAGVVTALGLDSGFYVGPGAVAAEGPAGVRVHRLPLWPKTRTPWLLLVNRQSDAPAVFGTIRLYGPREVAGISLGHRAPVPTHLPPLFARPPAEGRRLLAYYDRPLFPENFSATEALDAESGRCLDDWRTFYEGGTRLTEHLQAAGYSGALLAVAADGSAIYPSERLRPTPRYDTGAFFSTGQDPVQKDVLEMLLQLFDRAGLQLVPTLQLAAPLPALEERLRQAPDDVQGLRMCSPDGRSWEEQNAPPQPLAPRYNPLHPEVQATIADLVREVVARAAAHRSFAGVGLQLSAQGYGQFPGPLWGADEITIRRFERATGGRVPRTPDQQIDAQALATEPLLSAWLAWRSAELAKFYQSLAAIVTADRPEARLVLAPVDPLGSPALARLLRPGLPRPASVVAALQQAGLDLDRLAQLPGVVCLRPQRLAAPEALPVQAARLELNRGLEVDAALQAAREPGALAFHLPQETRLEEFDRQGPFNRSYTRLLAELSPGDADRRRPLVEALALSDVRWSVEGGWLLPLGQEAQCQAAVAAYRMLPDAPFQSLPFELSPVTFRGATVAGQTFHYLANASPWPVRVTFTCEHESGVQPIVLQAEQPARDTVPALQPGGAPGQWTADLQAYDLLALRWPAPRVDVVAAQCELPAATRDLLDAQIRSLGARVASLQQPPAWEVLANPSFEEWTEEGLPADWSTSDALVQLSADVQNTHEGDRALRLQTPATGGGIASASLPAPRTGRCSVSVWLRTAPEAVQPRLRVALEGVYLGQPYYRYAALGAGGAATPLSAEWSQYVLQFSDLPAAGLSDLHVRFDLQTGGEVWIDDVQVFDLVFTPDERLELAKLITSANFQFQAGDWAECQHLLAGYWPQFLEEYVPAQALPEIAGPSPPQPEAAPPAPARTGFLDRVRGVIPWFR